MILSCLDRYVGFRNPVDQYPIHFLTSILFAFLILIWPSDSNAAMRIFCSDICNNACFNFESIRSDSKDRCQCGPQYCGTEALCRKYRGNNFVFNPNAKNRAERCLPKLITNSTPISTPKSVLDSSGSFEAKVSKPSREDENCSEQHFEYARARKACMQGDPAQCLFVYSPIASALATGIAARANLDSYFQKLDSSVQQRIRTIQDRIAHVEKSHTARVKQIDQNFHARTKKMSSLMLGIQRNLSQNSNQLTAADVGLDESSKELLRRQFPNEMKEIEPIMDEFKKASQAAADGKIEIEDMHNAFQRYQDEMAKLKKRHPRMQLVLALSQRDNYKIFNQNKMDDVVNDHFDRAQDKKVRSFNRAHAAYQNELKKLDQLQEYSKRSLRRSASAARVTAMGVAAIGSGAMAFAPGLRRTIEIDGCKFQYNLSDDEVKYLKGSFSPSPQSDAIARAELAANSCQDLELTHPVAAYHELKSTLGYIPKGICEIMRRQTLRIEEKLMVPSEISMPENPSCDGKFEVTYSTRDGVRIIRAPYIENTKSEMAAYPLFQSAQVFDADGKLLPLQTQELVSAYHRLHTPRTTRPDLVDYSFLADYKAVPQMQTISNLIRAAHKNRENFARNCTLTESAQPSSTAESSTKTQLNKSQETRK